MVTELLGVKGLAQGHLSGCNEGEASGEFYFHHPDFYIYKFGCLMNRRPSGPFSNLKSKLVICAACMFSVVERGCSIVSTMKQSENSFIYLIL